jgi:hypothetical protein
MSSAKHPADAASPARAANPSDAGNHAHAANPAHAALVRELGRTLALNAERAANPILAGSLDRLRAWQAARLRQTYADLAAQPRYAQAITFFEQDLYGDGDFSRRDADLMRIVPAMVRVLPHDLVGCIARAVELNALSHELDVLLLARLPRADAAFSVADYCRAYRRAGEFSARRRQVELIGDVGAALDRYVHKRLVRTSLALMRKPAHLAGLGALQDFLERGVAAFRAMHGAQAFLDTVRERETALHEAIAGGSLDPFPDPSLVLAPGRARWVRAS